VGVLNADGGVGYTIINFASILHQFCINFASILRVRRRIVRAFHGFWPIEVAPRRSCRAAAVRRFVWISLICL
jgi:hypothetical protein